MKIGIHIFHRDLRLYDNTALYELASQCDSIIPVFIFDPRQIEESRNRYFSSNCVQFMVESLEDLYRDQLVKRHKCNTPLLFKGNPVDVLQAIRRVVTDITHMSMNMDYTPFAKKRDTEILNWCKSHDITANYSEDITLHPIGSIRTASSNDVFKVFTPFFRAASKHPVRAPQSDAVLRDKFRVPTAIATVLKRMSMSMTIQEAHSLYTKNPLIAIHGGRSNGLSILSGITDHRNYNKNRDTPSIPSTMLSAHNKFGTVSVRELHEVIVNKLGNANHLYTQLFWRDFYYNIAYAFPQVFGHAFRPKYDAIRWENDESKFRAWKEGRTGVPIIDAGMRQLNTTGFMHNRLRMMVSMYLVKDLHIDWRWGERYFATQLVDYDPAQNNGGWQWSASTGTDSQPYFRIFNPYTMTAKVDPDATYIYKWVPELRDVVPRDFAKWDNAKVRGRYDLVGARYPENPIVEHDLERKKTLEIFRHVG